MWTRLVQVVLVASLLWPVLAQGAPAPMKKPDEAEKLYRQGMAAFEGPKDPIDEEYARKLFARAAGKGHPVAAAILGWMTAHGIGGPKDEDGGLAMVQKAMPAVRKRAAAGSAYAQEIYGVFLADGVGVEANEKEGAEWVAKTAADNGRAGAMASLGIMYSRGRGVPRDGKKVVEWLRKAIENGDNTALFWLGYLYVQGNGVEQDHKKVAEYYRKGADKGCTLAMVYLAGDYGSGQGVDRDYDKAIGWYKKAAGKGNLRAMHALGSVYEGGGLGVEIDRTEALKWYKKAADRGDSYAKEKVLELGGD